MYLNTFYKQCANIFLLYLKNNILLSRIFWVINITITNNEKLFLGEQHIFLVLWWAELEEILLYWNAVITHFCWIKLVGKTYLKMLKLNKNSKFDTFKFKSQINGFLKFELNRFQLKIKIWKFNGFYILNTLTYFKIQFWTSKPTKTSLIQQKCVKNNYD